MNATTTTLVSPGQTLVYGIAGAATGLTAVLVVIHIVTRRVAKASVWWDDSLLWIGSCFAITLNALNIYGASLGLGEHAESVSSSHLESILKVLFSNTLLHLWAVISIKASLLLFFHRLFRSNKPLRWTVYFSLCLLFTWLISFTLITLADCTPISSYWKQNVDGKCMTANWVARTSLAIIDATFNVITDFLWLIAPWPVLRRLQWARGKKACLAAVYLLGGCKVIIVIIRLLYQLDTPASTDITYAATLPTILLILETNLAVACASLPSLTALNARIFFVHPRPSTPNKSPYSGRPAFEYSETSLFLQGFKRQPLGEWPILTTVTSNDPMSVAARLPSLDMGNFSQESITQDLKPAGVVVSFNVEQTVERSDSIV